MISPHLMQQLRNTPVRELIRALERDGFSFRRRQGSGRLYRHPNPALTGLRLWRIPGFECHLIFYRPVQDGIEVIRVLHAARDIDAILEQEE